jgi:hypothetical protein
MTSDTSMRVEYLPVAAVLTSGRILFATSDLADRGIIREKIRKATERHTIPITAIYNVEARCMVEGPVPQAEKFDEFWDILRANATVEVMDYHVRYRSAWNHLNVEEEEEEEEV